MPIDPNFSINDTQFLQSGLGFFGDPNQGDTEWLPYFPEAQVRNNFQRHINRGITVVRLAGPDYSSNANFFLNRIAWEMKAAEIAFSMGLDVDWGIVPKFGIKPSEWAFYIDGIDQFVQAFQTLVNSYPGRVGRFIVLNENEANYNLGRDPIVSMTRTSNVVTVDMGTRHSLANNDSLIYFNSGTGNGSGSTMGIFSNSFISPITVVDPNKFSFPSVGADGTTTVGWFTYSSRTVINSGKRIATHFLTLTSPSITMPLIAAVVGNTAAATIPPTYYIGEYVTLGRGPFDVITLNIYGEPIPYRARMNDFIDQIRVGYNGFGPTHFEVSELNLYANDNAIPNNDPIFRESLMIERINGIKQFPDLRYTYFAYQMPDKLAEAFPAYGIVTAERPTLPIFVRERPRTVEIHP